MTDKEKFRKEVEKLKSNLIHGACSSQIAMETRCKEEAYNEVLAILDTMQEDPVSIWHDASEKPNIKEKSGIFVITSLNGEYIGSRYYNHNDITITLGNYDKWAYLNDLLNLSNVQRTGKNWKEPVSEELEEASKEWLKPQIDKSYESYGESMMMELTHFDGYAMLDAIEFGAKWQKTKDESTTEDLGEYIDKLSKQFPEVSFAKLSRISVRVAKWQKEQDQETIELAEDHAMLAGMEKMKEEMMAKAIEGKVLVNGMGNPILHLWDKGRELIDKKVKVIVIEED